MPIGNMNELIRECSTHLIRNNIDTGAAGKMFAPLVNVFWGKGSGEVMDAVRDVYRSCWSVNDGTFLCLQGSYSEAEASAVYKDAVNRQLYRSSNDLVLAYFWDAMDDGFEEQLSILKRGIAVPPGVIVHTYVFFFCSQMTAAEDAEVKERLSRLNACLNGRPGAVVLLSNIGQRGPMREKETRQNYRIAADVVAIADSYYYNTAAVDDPGLELRFRLEQDKLFTADYSLAEKPFDEIGAVSLEKILSRLSSNNQEGTNGGSVCEKICGTGRTYTDLLDDFFREMIEPQLLNAEEIGFLSDLPVTNERVRLEESMNGGKSKKGILGFGRAKNNGADLSGLLDAYTFSLGEMWQTVYDLHYRSKAEWIGTEAGEKKVLDFFARRIMAGLQFGELQRIAGSEENQLREDRERCSFAPEMREGESLASFLDRYAVVQLKKEYYERLFDLLEKCMKEVGQKAPVLVRDLETVRTNIAVWIGQEEVGQDIRRAYGNHMANLCDSERLLLRSGIHPCDTMEELLEQIAALFGSLVESPAANGVYTYPFQKHLEFLSDAMTAQARGDTVMREFFEEAMGTNGRIRMNTPAFNGTEYCLCANGVNLPETATGKRFYGGRQDCIERLYVYPIREGDMA